MKNENSKSGNLNVKLLTDTSPSICDPALHRIAGHGRSVLETLNGAIRMLNGPGQEKKQIAGRQHLTQSAPDGA